ncbi:hypothetical protein [Sphingopyxis flava]|uniref:Uncharacterized protein n=1 Tax=Sphingopyxis flava TaxID=1507287 RepID=A0A1T5ACA9_9SPHN|nr:hypothetical protein [Sphingopyxis flava]SKB32323.1 hypothetical protein SAMN06295937_100367 [Sphingopyxis flava]
MPVYVTFHDSNSARGANGSPLALLGRRLLARDDITVAAEAAASSAAAPCDCLVSISATEDCAVEIGEEDAASATDSEIFLQGRHDVRVIREGEFVSAIGLGA